MGIQSVGWLLLLLLLAASSSHQLSHYDDYYAAYYEAYNDTGCGTFECMQRSPMFVFNISMLLQLMNNTSVKSKNGP